MAEAKKLEFFEDTVLDVMTKQGYSDVKVNLVNISQLGVNFLGDIIRVTVDGKKEGKSEKRNLIIKAVPADLNARATFKTDEKFHTEAFVYEKVMPILDYVQEKCQVKEKFKHCEVLKIVPEEFKEMMLMEDLTADGYQQCKIGKVLDLEHVMNIVRNIGRMHAVGYATKKHFPEKIRNLFAPLKDVFQDKIVEGVTAGAFDIALKTVTDPRAKDWLIKSKSGAYEYMLDASESGKDEPFGVLVHGDVWTNNILFKYEGTKLIDSIFLDWQIVRYHTPILDLLFFLFTSADDDVRGPNFKFILDHYYKSLAEFLCEMDCDPEELFPEWAFREHLKKFGKFSLMILLFMILVFTGDNFDPSTFNASSSSNGLGFPTLSKLYVKRINGTFRDFFNNDLL